MSCEEVPLHDLSDIELSKLLKQHGLDLPVTSTTRSALERKLAHLSNQQLPSDTLQENVLEDATVVTTSSAQDDKSNGCYLLIHSGNVPDDLSLTLKKCYYSKQELHDVMKKLKGSRFKWFVSEEKAMQALENMQTDTKQPEATASKESVNLFPSVSTVELNKFRKLIEDGNIEEFKSYVQNNPRYLVSAGDAPEIVKLGTRYNAMHVAVRSNKLELCREVVSILRSEDFWSKLYPEDSRECREHRRCHLLDLYLNMPDKIANETPLHFACKGGFEDIVRLLLSFPETDATVINKAGLTAREVICQNNRQSSAVRRIEDLFQDTCYVPVYRSVDNSVPPMLGNPCSLEECHSPPLTSSQSPVNPCLVGTAFAGPLSPAKAKDLRKRWRSPSRALDSIKKSDADKGLERVGRQLAYGDKTEWTEYWQFLGGFCDLAKPEGLTKLEQYLKDRHDNSEKDTPSSPQLSNSMEYEPNSRSSNMLGVTERLSDLTLEKTPTPQVFLLGSFPTKLDFDVAIALEAKPQDLSQYPMICEWLELVNLYTMQEKMCWSTPRKNRPPLASPLLHRTPNMPYNISIASPLLFDLGNT